MNNRIPPPRFPAILAAVVAAALALFVTAQVLANGGVILSNPFDLPEAGCPQAHCDLQMSDQIGVIAPVSPTAIVYTDDLSIGSTKGLGCSSNGVDTVACTFGKRVENDCPTGGELVDDTLAIYRIDGQGDISVWRSGELLSCRAYASVPLIAEDGSLITADEKLIVRIKPDDQTAWSTTHSTEAIPISPILVQTAGMTQVVVLATVNLPQATHAPVYAYDTLSGTHVGEPLTLAVEGERFGTRNTPGGLDQRIYISAGGITNTTAGRLFAVDVFSTGLSIVWGDEDYGQSTTSFIAPPVDFIGPSGASPLIVPLLGNNTQTMFDGDLEINNEPEPHMIAVRDDVSGPTLVWTKTMTGAIQASFALDLRDVETNNASFWTFTTKDPEDNTSFADHKYLYRYEVADGDFVEKIDVDDLVNETGVYVPSSAISMAGIESNPVLTVSASRFVIVEGRLVPISTFVIAIDLDDTPEPSLLWKVETPFTAGQFPITDDATNGPLVWSTTSRKGIRVIGEE